MLPRWDQTSPGGAAAFQEMIRFNEAVDQVLAESVRYCPYRTERICDFSRGRVGPRPALVAGSSIEFRWTLQHDEALSPVSVRAVAFVQRAATRNRRLSTISFSTVPDLGDAQPLSFMPQDLGRIRSDAVDEVPASYPTSRIDPHLAGEFRSQWDGSRHRQLIVNMLAKIPKRALPTLYGSADAGQHAQQN
jgi:hypothetical protein